MEPGMRRGNHHAPLLSAKSPHPRLHSEAPRNGSALHGKLLVDQSGGLAEGLLLVELHEGNLDLVLVFKRGSKLHDVDRLAMQILDKAGVGGKRRRAF